MERPPALPEGILIRRAREASGLTVPAAAQAAGMSKARWTQVETGYETRQGQVRRVQAKPGTIARMAHAVGLDPDRLASQGERPDAAEILREILLTQPGGPRLSPVADPAPPLDLTTASDALIGAFIEAWPVREEMREEDEKFKDGLRRTWMLYTVAHGDRDTVVDALAAVLHRGVPRLAEKRAEEEAKGRATS